MKNRSGWKKGAILLQTLVMSVILSMISVMVMQWIMARYLLVNRVQQSARDTGNAQGFAAVRLNRTTPDTRPAVMDNKQVKCIPAGTKYQVTVVDTY
ncbi:MAG: hypothetical protein WCW52_04290 [Elusimicrobiales bacterium]|jgi:hypothetical protein